MMSYLTEGQESSLRNVWDFEYKAVAFSALYALSERAHFNSNVISVTDEAFIKRCSNINEIKEKVKLKTQSN